MQIRRRRKNHSGRLKLLLAAESLFGKRGAHGVSLREIAAAARNLNNNAVQYHFRSKAGLIQAIMRHRIAQLEEMRGARLKALLESGDADDVKSLLNAYFLPHLDLIGEGEGYPYAGFMTEYLTRLRPQGVAHVGDSITPQSVHLQSIFNRIVRSTSYLPLNVFQARFELCHLMFFNTIVRWEHGPHFGNVEQLRRDIYDTLEVIAASLAVPAPS